MNRPTAVEDLQQAIEDEIGAISSQLCLKITSNFAVRLHKIDQAAIQHFENVVH